MSARRTSTRASKQDRAASAIVAKYRLDPERDRGLIRELARVRVAERGRRRRKSRLALMRA
jgi:hypothetical protein